jgi:hypothetical protein
MKSYVDDLKVDPESRTEMILVNQLVECDIIDYRANVALSTDKEAWGLLKIDTTTLGEGVVNETTNPHPILEIKERTQSRRLKVLEALSATRKERTKRAAALGNLEDGELGALWSTMKKAAQTMSHIRPGATIEELKEELASDDSEITDADWEDADFTK